MLFFFYFLYFIYACIYAQVVYGVFVLFCPFGEAVSQTVQTYLPGFTIKRPPRANGKPRKSLTFGKVKKKKGHVAQ